MRLTDLFIIENTENLVAAIWDPIIREKTNRGNMTYHLITGHFDWIDYWNASVPDKQLIAVWIGEYLKMELGFQDGALSSYEFVTMDFGTRSSVTMAKWPLLDGK